MADARADKRARDDSNEPTNTSKRVKAIFIAPESHVEDLELPAFVIKLETLRRNCRIVAERAKTASLALRPHVKTTKCFEAAKIQVEHGPWPASPEDGVQRPAIVVSLEARAPPGSAGACQVIFPGFYYG